ncbi:hypothetical protein E4U31_004796, partial [Claviceps sp. LM219 group G6]
MKNCTELLSRSEQDMWYRRMKLRLRAEGIEYVIEQSLHEYAWIETLDSAADEKTCVASTTEYPPTQKDEEFDSGDTSKNSD